MKPQEKQLTQINIPWESLSEEALKGVIEEFVTREGTEYGLTEVDLESKRRQVRSQLSSGQASITYDDELMSCSIVSVDG